MTDVCEYVTPFDPLAPGPAPDPAPTAIATTGLVRRFGSLVAVDGIDLDIAAGEIYGFLGPNGAGKSTLLRVLCTLLRPSAGHAVVAGYDVVEEPQEVRFRIGVALQEAALDDRQNGPGVARPPGPALRADDRPRSGPDSATFWIWSTSVGPSTGASARTPAG